MIKGSAGASPHRSGLVWQTLDNQVCHMLRLNGREALRAAYFFARGVVMVDAMAGHADHLVLWAAWHEGFVGPLLSEKRNRRHLEGYRKVQYA